MNLKEGRKHTHGTEQQEWEHTVLTSSKWSIWHPIRKDVGAITKSSMWRDRIGTKVCCHWRGWRYNIKHSATSVSKAQSEEKKTILCSVKMQVKIWKQQSVYKELHLEHTAYTQIFHLLAKQSHKFCFLRDNLRTIKIEITSIYGLLEN